ALLLINGLREEDDVRVVFLFLLRQARHAHDLLTLRELDEAHPLRVAADDRDAAHGGANHLAAVGDQHNVIVVAAHPPTDDRAGLAGGLHGDHALAAARLQAVLIHLGALPVATLGDGEQRGTGAGDGDTDNAVVLLQRDAAHAGGAASHRAH